MLISIPDVLRPEQVREARQILDSTDWIDGKVTAGHQSHKPFLTVVRSQPSSRLAHDMPPRPRPSATEAMNRRRA